MYKISYHLLLFLFLFNCQSGAIETEQVNESTILPDQFIVVLGVAQDAGYPQADCKKECCKAYWTGKTEAKYTSCLGIVNRKSKQIWMIDATPNFKTQLKNLQSFQASQNTLDGIFLTHAHMGHYTGLLHLGREVIGADSIPVYAMPRMADFLSSNGPWDQLVSLKNISIQRMSNEQIIPLSNSMSIQPFLVPHRDEYSETVGYKIIGPKHSFIFIPDIDKWGKWEKDIRAEIKKVDYAFLDGTFYQNGELPNRDMSQIPHPFIEESMNLFSDLEELERKKVHFIHLNHTNPLLRKNTKEYRDFESSGFNLAKEGMVIEL